jgi:hypothetical protein
MRNSAIFALAIGNAGVAVAQQPQRPDPRDPKAPVPAVPYRSAFEGYRPYVEPPLAPWREVNEKAGEAAQKPRGKPPARGGHEGHK